MKKIFSTIFLVGIAVGLAYNPAIAVVSFFGLFFCQAPVKDFAFLQIVPMKYVTATGENVPYGSRAEKSLFDQLITLGRSNQVTADAIAQGAISFDPISYYVRMNITGLSGTVTFINQALTRVVGLTNIPNQATLPQYYNFCFDRITVRTALTNTANTAVGAVSGWTSVSASVDPAVRNSELRIRSNRNLIVETPTIDFLSAAAVTGGGVRDYDGGILEKPRFFLEQLNIEAEIALPQGVTVTNTVNTTTWMEVVFSGVQARLKF